MTWNIIAFFFALTNRRGESGSGTRASIWRSGSARIYCLDAELARLEAKVALEELPFSCPPFAAHAERVQRILCLIIRGRRTLPLKFRFSRR